MSMGMSMGLVRKLEWEIGNTTREMEGNEKISIKDLQQLVASRVQPQIKLIKRMR